MLHPYDTHTPPIPVTIWQIGVLTLFEVVLVEVVSNIAVVIDVSAGSRNSDCVTVVIDVADVNAQLAQGC